MRKLSLALLITLTPVGACDLDERDLASFVHTAAGPEKLRALLQDDSRSPELRAQAAHFLLGVARPSVSGAQVFLDDFKKLSPEQRGPIAAQLTPVIARELAQVPTGAPLEPAVIRTKDACVELLPMLPEASQQKLGAMLLDFVLADASQRADAGEFTLEQIAHAAGAVAAEHLLGGLSTHGNGAFLTRVSTLIDAVASSPARKQVAARLLELERTLRIDAGPSESPNAASGERALGAGGERALAEAAQARDQAERVLVRERHLLPALGRFVDQAEVRERLVKLAGEPVRSTAERVLALELLATHVTPVEVPKLLAITLDEGETEPLRVLALSRASELRSANLVAQLLPLVGDRSHARLRQLASSYVIDVGGGPNLVALFRAMPKQWQMPYAREEIDAYSNLLVRIDPDVPLIMVLADKLHSVFWWQRVLALRYFAARGIFEDIWRIRQHINDALYTYGEGWPKGYTVGQEAAACIVQAEKRFAVK